MPAQSDLPLRLSAWYLNHLDQLRRWWMRLLMVVTVVLLGTGATSLVRVGMNSRSLGPASAARVGAPLFTAPVRDDLPAPLVVSSPRAIAIQAGRVDAVVEIRNPNEAYAVRRLRYRLRVGDRELPERTTILLPGSRRFLFEANVPTTATTPAVTFDLLDVALARPADPARLKHVAFDVRSTKLDLTATAGRPARPAPRLTATVANSGLVGLRSVTFSIALVANGLPVAVTERTAANWQRDEVRTIEAQWLQTVPSNAEAVVVGQTDLFDEANLLR